MTDNIIDLATAKLAKLKQKDRRQMPSAFDFKKATPEELRKIQRNINAYAGCDVCEPKESA